MKPVLFIDFHGTLCNDLFWCSLTADMYQKLHEIDGHGETEIARQWMKGVYSSEEINQKMAAHLNMPYEELWQLFVNDCKGMSISKETLERISALRKKYHLILMTDNMDCFERFILPPHNLDLYFDEIINSYNTHILKDEMEGKAFSDVVSKVNSKVEGSILIDNSKKYCEIFEKLGGKAFNVTEDQNIDYWLEKVNEL